MSKAEGLSSEYPPISDLIDPGWLPHPERLLLATLDEVVFKSNALGPKTPVQFPDVVLARFSEGLLLDVGCGNIFGVGSTFVDLLPNAYGIDPTLQDSKKYPGHGEVPRDRVIAGFAEDLPFCDKTFRTTISMKCVGWYPNVTVNPYWAIREMVRVTEDGGLISIFIGQQSRNSQIILDAIQQVKADLLGDRIAAIKDFSDTPSPQVGIRLI